MKYEVIRNATEIQMSRIETEYRRVFRKNRVSFVRANGVDIGFLLTVLNSN